MRAIELKCVEPGHTEKHWLLDIGGESAVLCTPDGAQVAVFPQQDAKRRFQMPGLANGVKHFSIALDEQTVPFAVDLSGLDQIERYLNRDLIVSQRSAPPSRTNGQMNRLNARPRSGIVVTPPVKIFFGVLGILFMLMNVASIVMNARLLMSGRAFGASVLVAHVTGIAFGLLIAALCLRSKKDPAADDYN